MAAATLHHRLCAALRMRQLELIVCLVDTGSMRAAAQRLHLSAAAVSKGLREVESLFGLEVFHRMPSGVVLTPAGELIADRARLLLGEVGRLADELAARRSGGAGDQVRVGAQPFLAWALLPRVLQAMEAGSGVQRVRVVEGRMGDICRQLEAGDLDVLLTMNQPSELGGLRGGGFIIEPLYTEQWAVVCSPAHHLAPRAGRRERRRWADLREERWILPPRLTASRVLLEQVLLAHSLPPLMPWIESMSAIANLSLAEQCHGIALAARCVLAEPLARGALVEIPMKDPLPCAAIVLVYRADGASRSPVAALRAAAQRVCSAATEVESRPSRAARKFSPRKSRA
ncbi:LysR family transcriptional regulator [Ottowia sp.]|uniref:LysR family transcriptional regulator n=1 Tax=Ottowia sp. TaxID=1898956 RepID=UPI0039E40C22